MRDRPICLALTNALLLTWCGTNSVRASDEIATVPRPDPPGVKTKVQFGVFVVDV